MADPLLGKHLGRYELRALLGVGGMARVYTAFDHTLERQVALKVLHTAAQPADFAERFRLEAHTLASLCHPNIVQIYDYGRQDELSFIVQQLQPGPTLEHELAALAAQGRNMERAAVRQVITQLADALDYAHSCKLVHRDLKPSNIIRNERGDVVLTDFGIAKALTSPLTQTQAGLVLGTPAYLSPEQARSSSSVSRASDIYSLGVILFELLTGQLPFNDAGPMEVLIGHIQQPPPSPRALRPDLPPDVERVVLKALAKEPCDRYATAGALARALIAAWPDTPLRSIHTQPTAVNPTPLGASKTTRSVGGGAPQPVHDTPTTASSSRIARPLATAPINRPRRKQRGRGGLALLTLPALLLAVIALFFTGLPGGSKPSTTPTTTMQLSEPVGAVGLATTTPEPTITLTTAPTLTFTALTLASPPTASPTLTFTAPTLTSTPVPTFAPTPVPTFAPTPAPTIISTSAPTFAPNPPSVPLPPLAPQPSVKVPDF